MPHHALAVMTIFFPSSTITLCLCLWLFVCAYHTKANYTIPQHQNPFVWDTIAAFGGNNALVLSSFFANGMPDNSEWRVKSSFSGIQETKPSHSGEKSIRKKLGYPGQDDEAVSCLSRQAAFVLQGAQLLGAGTVDDQGRPWTTIWGGGLGFARPIGGDMLGIKTWVDERHDPVANILCPPTRDANPQKMAGRVMAFVSINMDTRYRVKVSGQMVAGAVAIPENTDDVKPQAEIQLVSQITESIGNCPKYINRKEIKQAHTKSVLVSDSPILCEEAVQLILKADLFFLSSTNDYVDMDTNHRGGPPGFTRVDRDEQGNSIVVWPEYSGNRFVQHLGNLEVTPLAGMAFPDFDTGDVVFLTGKTETLIGKEADAIMPRAKTVVRLTVTGSKFVRQGMPFRGETVENSPYNPRLRPLASEAALQFGQSANDTNTVKLVDRTMLTPTVARLKFSMNNPTPYAAGQWVAFDFSDEFDVGYSHMREDDPTSLNDDFVRTFTVSSPPSKEKGNDGTFEVTMRRVGRVTKHMLRANERSLAEVPIRGFGGEFKIKQQGDAVVPFVAGGVGITPILAFLPTLDMSRFKLFWTLHVEDIDLAMDTIERNPAVKPTLEVFLTGVKDQDKAKKAAAPLVEAGIKVEYRRLTREDLRRPEFADTWHICVGTGLRKTLLEWLNDKEVLYESFNF